MNRHLGNRPFVTKHFTSGLLAIAAILAACSASTAAAQEPGWLPVIVAEGHLREHLKATPIVHRPYRPFHFYGNAVRRSYYRGTPLPQLSDLRRTFSAALRAPMR